MQFSTCVVRPMGLLYRIYDLFHSNILVMMFLFFYKRQSCSTFYKKIFSYFITFSVRGVKGASIW
jgi:hypothetical protein